MQSLCHLLAITVKRAAVFKSSQFQRIMYKMTLLQSLLTYAFIIGAVKSECGCFAQTDAIYGMGYCTAIVTGDDHESYMVSFPYIFGSYL